MGHTPNTILVLDDGTRIREGDRIRDFRGEEWTCEGWQIGSHSGSTGRVFVTDGQAHREYFPGVFGAKIEIV
jgi:hypothetical protein